MQTTGKLGSQKRPVGAALLSAVLPGAGQWYAGHRRRALVLLGVDLLLIVLAGLAYFNQLEVVKAAFRPDVLVGAMLGNIALLAFRLWAADDAYRLAAQSGRGRFTPLAGVVLGLLILGPHLVAGYYDIVHYDFITTTFAQDEVTTTTTTTTTTSAPAGVASGTSASSGSTTTTTEAVAVEPGPVLWDGLERLNIALLGADAGVGRRSIRTDTMIVVSIDPESGNVALFSLPRNMVEAPLPVEMGIWGCDCFPRMLNDLYVAGIESPEAFPGPQDPSVNAIKGGFGEILGIPIHYYAMVTLEGFVGVIDAIGGVTIDVPFRIVDETYPHEDGVTIEYVEIEPGVQQLDGHLALAYSRARRHADDYARMGRQRCVLNAILEEADPVALALGYPELAGVLGDTMETDIPLSRIPDFIDLLPKIDQENMISIRFIPPDYITASTSSGNIPDVDLIREHVQIVINSTPDEARTILGIDSLDDNC
ncbi:MAG: LCP family protein [Acidimicrobiia bacterium]|nr:LCP family protein [Acidimicrobiia bacterium]